MPPWIEIILLGQQARQYDTRIVGNNEVDDALQRKGQWIVPTAYERTTPTQDSVDARTRLREIFADGDGLGSRLQAGLQLACCKALDIITTGETPQYGDTYTPTK